MAVNFYSGVNHAAKYALFRPTPPPNLIRTVLNYLGTKEFGLSSLALDVGCGSGQSTNYFAQHFKTVLGIDISEAQIQEAIRKNTEANVSFRVSSAEKLPVPDQSIQLVTASQSCHWFNLPLFYEEVKRVLVPNGVMALYGYNNPSLNWKDKSEELNASFLKIYSEDTKMFAVPGRVLIEHEYEDEIFNIPFNDIFRSNDFHLEQTWTVRDVAGYVESWSSFQMYKRTKGSDSAQELIDGLIESLLKTMDETNPDEAKLTVHFPFFLLMGRKVTT